MPRKCPGASVKALRAWLLDDPKTHKGVRRVDLETCRVYDSRNLAVINRRFPTRGNSRSQIGRLVRFEVAPPRAHVYNALAIVDSSWKYPWTPVDRFAMAWGSAGMLAAWVCKRVGVSDVQLRKLRPYLKAHGLSPEKCYNWQRANREWHLRDLERRGL